MIFLQAQAPGMAAILQALILPALLFAMFYFMIIRPEKKRKAEYKAMLGTLQVNDEIVTKGGIVGKIIKLDDEHFVMETGPERNRLRFVRDAVYMKVEADKVETQVKRS